MVVQRYFYVDIDPIARQVATLRMREFITRFSQQFVTTTWKASFTFLPSNCHNPSLGLATKAKGIARVRAKRKPGS
jgi:hypothetical protein